MNTSLKNLIDLKDIWIKLQQNTRYKLKTKLPRKNITEKYKVIISGRQNNDKDFDMHYRMHSSTKEFENSLVYLCIEPKIKNCDVLPGIKELTDENNTIKEVVELEVKENTMKTISTKQQEKASILS